MNFRASSALGLLVLLAGPALAADPLALQQQWPANLHEGTSAESSAWRILNLPRWQEFWTRSLRREPPPAPDFEHGSVVVVAAGERPTGGYRVEVVRAVKESNSWVVEFVVHQPAPEAFVTQALTFPVAVAVFSGPGIFRPQVRDVSPPDAPARRSTQR